MKKFRNAAGALVVIMGVIVLSVGFYYNINMRGVSSDTTLREITINSGGIDSVARTLKGEGLIRNVTIFKVYVALTGKTNLKAGNYEFSQDMGVKRIVDILSGGTKSNPYEISITFKEGINVRKIATIISEETNNSYDDVINKMNDSTYIDSLIEKYWFLTNDIKSNGIYYPLEGYLYPNTYRFSNKDVSIEDIFSKMLDETDRELSEYKDVINSNSLGIHKIMTLASIVELEGAKTNDRRAVAGVFYNRLNSKSYPTLGSDATTYYGSKIDDWSYSLTNKELNDCSNKYNTRCSSNKGLPIGPICNPSITSVEASLNPEDHNYYYFVADCKGKVYLTQNSQEHLNIINKLKKENNWCA